MICANLVMLVFYCVPGNETWDFGYFGFWVGLDECGVFGWFGICD